MQLNHGLPQTTVPPKNDLEKQLPKGITHVEFGMTNYVVDEINARSGLEQCNVTHGQVFPPHPPERRARAGVLFRSLALVPALRQTCPP